jgi:hypothetical protein
VSREAAFLPRIPPSFFIDSPFVPVFRHAILPCLGFLIDGFVGGGEWRLEQPIPRVHALSYDSCNFAANSDVRGFVWRVAQDTQTESPKLPIPRRRTDKPLFHLTAVTNSIARKALIEDLMKAIYGPTVAHVVSGLLFR